MCRSISNCPVTTLLKKITHFLVEHFIVCLRLGLCELHIWDTAMEYNSLKYYFWFYVHVKTNITSVTENKLFKCLCRCTSMCSCVCEPASKCLWTLEDSLGNLPRHYLTWFFETESLMSLELTVYTRLADSQASRTSTCFHLPSAGIINTRHPDWLFSHECWGSNRSWSWAVLPAPWMVSVSPKGRHQPISCTVKCHASYIRHSL